MKVRILFVCCLALGACHASATSVPFDAGNMEDAAAPADRDADVSSGRDAGALDAGANTTGRDAAADLDAEVAAHDGGTDAETPDGGTTEPVLLQSGSIAIWGITSDDWVVFSNTSDGALHAIPLLGGAGVDITGPHDWNGEPIAVSGRAAVINKGTILWSAKSGTHTRADVSAVRAVSDDGARIVYERAGSTYGAKFDFSGEQLLHAESCPEAFSTGSDIVVQCTKNVYVWNAAWQSRTLLANHYGAELSPDRSTVLALATESQALDAIAVAGGSVTHIDPGPVEESNLGLATYALSADGSSVAFQRANRVWVADFVQPKPIPVSDAMDTALLVSTSGNGRFTIFWSDESRSNWLNDRAGELHQLEEGLAGRFTRDSKFACWSVSALSTVPSVLDDSVDHCLSTADFARVDFTDNVSRLESVRGSLVTYVARPGNPNLALEPFGTLIVQDLGEPGSRREVATDVAAIATRVVDASGRYLVFAKGGEDAGLYRFALP